MEALVNYTSEDEHEYSEGYEIRAPLQQPQTAAMEATMSSSSSALAAVKPHKTKSKGKRHSSSNSPSSASNDSSVDRDSDSERIKDKSIKCVAPLSPQSKMATYQITPLPTSSSRHGHHRHRSRSSRHNTNNDDEDAFARGRHSNSARNWEKKKRDKDYSKSDRHHRIESKKKCDYKREREERRYSSGRNRDRDRDRTISRHRTKETRCTNSSRSTFSTYKSQSQQQPHHSQRRSFDESSRRRRDSLTRSRSRSRSRTRTLIDTLLCRRRQAPQSTRKYHRLDSRDSSSRSRSPPERPAHARKSNDSEPHTRAYPSADPVHSKMTLPSTAAALTATAMTAAATGGCGGLLPTPNYAPKIPSLMSLDLNTPPDALIYAPLAVVQLPKYYNPVIVNANRYSEQQQKRKLIWGSKKNDDSANKWGNAHFSQDSDGKMASKFMRLMGIKNANNNTANTNNDKNNTTTSINSSSSHNSNSCINNISNAAAEPTTEPSGSSVSSSTVGPVPADVQLRQRMFSNMEQQYEMARAATHTMRGVGLGFGSQPRSY